MTLHLAPDRTSGTAPFFQAPYVPSRNLKTPPLTRGWGFFINFRVRPLISEQQPPRLTGNRGAVFFFGSHEMMRRMGSRFLGNDSLGIPAIATAPERLNRGGIHRAGPHTTTRPPPPLASALRKTRQCLGGSDDGDALIRFEVEQVRITRDDQISRGSDGASKDMVVIGIGSNHGRHACRHNNTHEAHIPPHQAFRGLITRRQNRREFRTRKHIGKFREQLRARVEYAITAPASSGE